MTASEGLARPPEGAIVGESVPVENEHDERFRTTVDRLVGSMKGHPAYRHLNEAEIREKAREKAKHIHE